MGPRGTPLTHVLSTGTQACSGVYIYIHLCAAQNKQGDNGGVLTQISVCTSLLIFPTTVDLLLVVLMKSCVTYPCEECGDAVLIA